MSKAQSYGLCRNFLYYPQHFLFLFEVYRVCLVDKKQRGRTNLTFLSSSLNAVYVFFFLLFETAETVTSVNRRARRPPVEKSSDAAATLMLVILCRHGALAACQVRVFGYAGKCGLHMACVAFCQRCVRAACLQTQAGEGRGVVQWLRACKMVLLGPG